MAGNVEPDSGIRPELPHSSALTLIPVQKPNKNILFLSFYRTGGAITPMGAITPVGASAGSHDGDTASAGSWRVGSWMWCGVGTAW